VARVEHFVSEQEPQVTTQSLLEKEIASLRSQ
jgi:hypothetical protein